MLDAIRDHLQAEAANLCRSGTVPGYLAGVYHAGEQTVVAAGVANLATGAPMTEDTGYLCGSITKVFTSTLLLQCVERGQVDLDERVTTYLPDFTLAAPAKAGEIRVRNLLNHTNGIDGDLFWPDRVQGRDALKYYLQELSRCSTLFDPGEYVSYSNAGMLVAGRLLEVVTGESYHGLLERELYHRVGMADSCTSAEQAILRRTAVGHFFDPQTRALRRTGMFMLPDTWSACGATPITTIADMLAFARTHLADGLAPSGERLLSTEMAQRMRVVTVDMGTPNVSPIGLGWSLLPVGQVLLPSISGASPGGAASLVIFPDHDLAFAAFGNASGAAMLSDRLALWLLHDYLGLDLPDLPLTSGAVSDLSPYEGTYRSNQMRVDVKAVDGQLEEQMTYEPLDEDQARIYAGFSGSQLLYPPRRLVPVGDGLFAPAGIPLEAFKGYMRVMLVSFHGRANGRATHRTTGGRMTRRQSGAALGNQAAP